MNDKPTLNPLYTWLMIAGCMCVIVYLCFRWQRWHDRRGFEAREHEAAQKWLLERANAKPWVQIFGDDETGDRVPESGEVRGYRAEVIENIKQRAKRRHPSRADRPSFYDWDRDDDD